MMLDGSPPGPFESPLNIKTIAELTKLPNHDKKPRALSQGPIESALQGMGRLLLIAIFIASERNSTQLLIRNDTGASGQIAEKRDR